MSFVIDLAPEIENRLSAEAARRGQPMSELVVQLLERELKPIEFDLEGFMTLPREEQDKVLSAAAEDAAPLYCADQALPSADRELTAFTALDGDAFVVYE